MGSLVCSCVWKHALYEFNVLGFRSVMSIWLVLILYYILHLVNNPNEPQRKKSDFFITISKYLVLCISIHKHINIFVICKCAEKYQC